MNNIYLGDAYAHIDTWHEKAIAEYDAAEAARLAEEAAEEAEYAEQVMLEEAMDAVTKNYHQEGELFLEWIVKDDARFNVLTRYLCRLLERPSGGAERLEEMLEAYAKESLQKLKAVRNGS